MAEKTKITETSVSKSEEDTVREIVKHRRPNSSLNRQVQTEDGDNTKYLQHSLEISSLGSVNIRDSEQVQNRITEYFKICIKNDMKPSVAGLALAFNLSRKTIWEYANGRTKIPQTCVDEFQRAYSILNAQMEDYMQNGKINPVSGIFLMKNNMGYHDQQEYVVTPNINPEATAEELINEAKQLPDISDD